MASRSRIPTKSTSVAKLLNVPDVSESTKTQTIGLLQESINIQSLVNSVAKAYLESCFKLQEGKIDITELDKIPFALKLAQDAANGAIANYGKAVRLGVFVDKPKEIDNIELIVKEWLQRAIDTGDIDLMHKWLKLMHDMSKGEKAVEGQEQLKLLVATEIERINAYRTADPAVSMADFQYSEVSSEVSDDTVR